MINRIDQDEEAVERPFDGHMFSRLLNYILPYRRLLFLAASALIIGTAAQLAVPYFTKIAIDQDIVPRHFQGLIVLAIALAVVYGVRYGAYRMQTFTISKLGQEVLRDLRSQLFHHLQELNFSFFDRIPGGKIMTRVLSDVSNLNQLLSSGLVNTLGNVLTLGGTIVMMLILKPTLALVSFLVIPLLVVLSTKLRRQIVERWRVVRRRTSIVNATWAESLNGARVVIAYGREKENQDHFNGLAHNNFVVWLRAMSLSALFGPAVDFAGTIGTVIVFWYGTTLYLHHQISLGLIVAFVSYLSGFWEPISQLGQFYNQLLVAMASAERVFEYIDQVPEVTDRPEAHPLQNARGEVIFDSVSFHYAADRPVLKDVSLTAPAGSTIALVGPTGAGKSSILSLIPRFYDVTQGRIMIDGQDVRDLTVESLRNHVALVLQDTFIFDGTIKDNIRYGRPQASDPEVVRAAHAVGADAFISELTLGYDTPVKERGSRLSLGQRQLLAFARAILADPTILILDEATASIDTRTEILVQQGLKTLLKGRTAFVAANRLSTIREADAILVIDHGHITEHGTHEQLLAKRGAYWRLISAQFQLEQSGGWFRHSREAAHT